MTEPAFPKSSFPAAAGPVSDPYRTVVALLTLLAFLGAAAAIIVASWIPATALLAAGVTLGLAGGVLIGVAYVQSLRARPMKGAEPVDTTEANKPLLSAEAPDELVPAPSRSRVRILLHKFDPTYRVDCWLDEVGEVGRLRAALAVTVTITIVIALAWRFPPSPIAVLDAAITAGACLLGAIVCAAAAQYFSAIEADRFPEAPGLCRGSRVTGWLLLTAAFSIVFAWLGRFTAAQVLQVGILLVDVLICFDLMPRKGEEVTSPVFRLDLPVFVILGNRPNILASILDGAEEQLGIDLRSTWALTVVRRGIEPLVIGLCIVAWLLTSLTVVGVEEQGLVERFGVPVAGAPLAPGLHLHWPWPVDQVTRIPVQRVNALQVGHEGEEDGGPENVVWTVEHAPNEYTLLLGNGRDLLTIDAFVQYKIVDAHAWRYNCQNPADALRAIAYRAVMRSTVNHTLSEALSENIVTLTGGIRTMIQQDADTLHLGVGITSFTIGGMHPPVPVAGAYEAVISAQIGVTTAVVDAQAYRNRNLPAADSLVLSSENAARSDAAEALGRAAGEAWSFRTLESQYRAAPEEYYFRRRLEGLESGLNGRRYTIIDSRILRDGGDLWLTP